MPLAQQNNLFGSPEPLKMQQQGQSPVGTRHKDLRETKCGGDPVLREMAAAVFEDLGHPFSPGDSGHWLVLFEEADKVDQELCSILMYMRGGGARLVPNSKFGYVIQPIIGQGAWESQEVYGAERLALNPYREQLTKLLKGLNEAMKKRR